MKNNDNKTSDAVTVLRNRYIKGNRARLASIAEEKAKLSIASQIYSIRKQHGLTQKELAEIMETTQSVISRLENTDYENERIETLQRLAGALQCHLEVRFVPDNTERKEKDKLKNFLLNDLTRAEKLIIILYYYKEMTMKEIGDVLDLSETQVSRMHSSIVARLRSLMNINDVRMFDAMFEEAFV